MARMREIVCKCGCGRKRMVRQADYDRGWGRFFDKSCKARYQERLTGQYSKHLHKHRRIEDPLYEHYRALYSGHPFSSEALGQWSDCE